MFSDAEGTFTGLMFQDNLMKSVFSSYPEVVLVDATHKLTNLKMPVYLKTSTDGNGQDEIVLVFLTAVETEQALTKMVHPQWTKTKVIMTDKDFNGRAVCWKEFPIFN